MDFSFEILKKREVKKPVMIEGLPGIGNVGKIAVDFIVESIKAEKIMTVRSHYFPHSVFVNEKNLVDLPKIDISYKKVKGQDIIFVTGDAQPIDEPSCYSFCELLLDMLQKWKAKSIVTTGGIGLQTIPKNPVVYITGNDIRITKTFKKCNRQIYGVVGPVIGVTGMLVGLAGRRKIPAVALLAQTFGHPAYVGMKGAKAIVSTLNEQFGFNVKTEILDKGITDLEKELKATQSIINISKAKSGKGKSMDYFG